MIFCNLLDMTMFSMPRSVNLPNARIAFPVRAPGPGIVLAEPEVHIDIDEVASDNADSEDSRDTDDDGTVGRYP